MRFVLGIAILVPASAQLFDPNRAEIHENIGEQFKYGSIGSEARGMPYLVWKVLPELFAKYLPAKPGDGYEKFGLIREPGRPRLVGIGYRERKFPMIGLNCAACHSGTVRDAPGEPRRIVAGMPAHQFDFQAYQRFLFACVRDPEFTPERLLKAIEKLEPKAGPLDKLALRVSAIPRIKQEGIALARSLSWSHARPLAGPGRVDIFNPFKTMFGFDMDLDRAVGAADTPPLFNLKVREGYSLYWDGSNDLLSEVDKTCALAAGATEASIDLESLKRIEDWFDTHKPPAFPQERIDTAKTAAGKKLFDSHCARCHDAGGESTGKVEPLERIATDPERADAFTPELAAKMNGLGVTRPWKFSHYRKTNGYANLLLDGVWLRAPYLHNGSVPTLRDLLNPPLKRPRVFWRGYDVYDYKNVGFVSSGPDAEREGFRFEVFRRGNGNEGHLYGTNLRESEKLELIEYLKTL